jgi:hypothetical protein
MAIFGSNESFIFELVTKLSAKIEALCNSTARRMMQIEGPYLHTLELSIEEHSFGVVGDSFTGEHQTVEAQRVAGEDLGACGWYAHVES